MSCPYSIRHTSRHHRKSSLLESKGHLDAIIASAMDAIISIDSEQRIILFNPAAEKMFGIPATEAIGESINRFIPERYRNAHTAQVAAFGQTGVSNRRMGDLGAISGLRANGEEFPLEASISKVQVQGEKIYTVILRDITRRQQAEKALVEARDQLEQKVQERTAKLRDLLSELEHFSYSITHDMRAPLRTMHSFITLMETDPANKLSPQSQDFLERIKVAAHRMDQLITDSLNYSKVVRQELPLYPVDVLELLRGIVQTYPNLQPPDADIRFEGEFPMVLGNEAGLTQCFSNLLGNAVKFVAPGIKPQVRVWAQTWEVERARVGPSESGASEDADALRSTLHAPTIRLWFEDNGIGIPKASQNELFGMFTRLSKSYEGTGIGLAIVRKAAERMGGRVGVESEPGDGSRFWLELKMAPAQPPPAQPKS